MSVRLSVSHVILAGPLPTGHVAVPTHDAASRGRHARAGTGRPAISNVPARVVALVGASGRPDNGLARPLREQAFAGEDYPVNPRYTELDGRPCYPSLAEVPSPVDLVLVMVPAAQAPDVAREAGRVGAAAAIVFASGVAEIGAQGAALQEQLRQAALDSGVRVLGPNCQGLMHASNGLFATFTAAADRPLIEPSGVAYVGLVALGWASTVLGEQVAEIEINPLIVAHRGGGAVAVDVLVR